MKDRTVDHILLVEDRKEDQILFEEVLSETPFRSASVQICESLNEAKQKLNETTFDIILLDLFLLDSSGLDTFNKLQKRSPSTPVIILTGLEDKQFALQSIENGAQDYLLKLKLKPVLLEKTIRYSIERQKIMNRLNYMHDQMNSFVHSVSHDIRGPIRNLNALMSLYKQMNEQQILDQIEGTISNLNTMMDNFSDFLRLLNSPDEKSTIDFKSLLDEVKDSIAPEIASANASIECDFSACPNIKFSKESIRSVFYNLVSNAIKYRSPARQMKIEISTYREGKFTCLRVKDNGVGIDMELHGKKIFDFSYQVNNGREGKGIGLYIIKTIAQNHGGYVDISSDIGKGSEFKIYLNSGE